MGEPPHKHATVTDYLAAQDASDERLELVDGHIVAMAGGTRDHATVIGNVYFELRQALRGHPCRPHVTNQKFRSPVFRNIRYPDVMVSCADRTFDPDDTHALANPVAVFEALSPSTEGEDRGPKFQEYRSTPSVRLVVFIDSRRPLVEVHQRTEDGWLMREYTDGEAILPGLDTTLALAALYADTEVEVAG